MLLKAVGFIQTYFAFGLDGNVKLVIRLFASMDRYLPLDLNGNFLLLFKNYKVSVFLDKSEIRHLEEEK